MTGTSAAKKTEYTPLGKMAEEPRAALLRGALALLAEGETLHDVAKHYSISKTTLIVALNYYAEEEWKGLQIARAQVDVQHTSEKRMQIAAELEATAALEKAGGETTETGYTYQRIREQLRIAEQQEKSAQWHLERLHKRLYGNSVAMTIEQHDPTPSPELLEHAGNLLEEIHNRIQAAIRMPTEEEAATIIERANSTDPRFYETWKDWPGEPNLYALLKKIGAKQIDGVWRIEKVVDAEILPAEPSPQPQAVAPVTTKAPTSQAGQRSAF